MADWQSYDLHGFAGVRIAADAPTAPLMADMLGPFASGPLPRYDLTITGEFEPVPVQSLGETLYSYSSTTLHLNTPDVQIVLEDGAFRLNGKRELLVFALPLIDRCCVQNGAAMVHSATIDYHGHGLVMPAWGGVGKTSTMAKLLRDPGIGFMGDDWAFISREAQLLAYYKPMFIKPHHRPIYPHLFSGSRKPLIPSRLSHAFAKLATTVHPMITKYPRLAGFSRRWSPEHMLVTARQALPQATFTDEVPLTAAVFVERTRGTHEVVLQERSVEWMVSRMVGNFHAEMTMQSQETVTALAASSLVPIEQYFGDKAEILQAALAGKPCFVVQVPQEHHPDQASDLIVEQLHRAMSTAGVAA